MGKKTIKKKIVAIVAVDENGFIGHFNDLPWHCKRDLKFFKQTTMGNVLILGRKTAESLGGTLPGRVSLIMSRSSTETYTHTSLKYWDSELEKRGCSYYVNELSPKGFEVAEMLSDRLGTNTIYVIGGANIYEEASPYVDEYLVTHIPYASNGNVKFPIDVSKYKVSEVQILKDAEVRENTEEKKLVKLNDMVIVRRYVTNNRNNQTKI